MPRLPGCGNCSTSLQGSRPLLFLLDELLQGTNSWDRRSGAEGIVRAFAARGAIGLISTHDLALTDISGLRAWSFAECTFPGRAARWPHDI